MDRFFRYRIYLLMALILAVTLLVVKIGTDPSVDFLEAPPSQQSLLKSLVVNDQPVGQVLAPLSSLPDMLADYMFDPALPKRSSKLALSLAHIPTSIHANQVINQTTAQIKRLVELAGFTYGSPILIRIFKVPSILEVWIKKGDRFELFKTYAICRFSGKLGPKTKVGDHQAPEGFYSITPKRLNPYSSYFLSFNLGYPNSYDQYHKRTGSALMVHGECASVGCYAMSNARMAEIYTLMYNAFANNQAMIQVQVYPFALTANNMKKMQRHQWYDFWVNLKQGYDYFDRNHTPPIVGVVAGKYRFSGVKPVTPLVPVVKPAVVKPATK